MQKINSSKRICPGCHFSGRIYDFSPSIEIGFGNFRIFHLYSGMRGTLYCNQCKRKHLLKIADQKDLQEKEKMFLKDKIKEKEKKYFIKSK